MTDVIVALDVDTIQEEERLLDQLKGTIRYYKIGLRLFTAHGKRAVDLVHRQGGRVFLDLKFHDLPQTVSDAVHEAQKMHVYSLSLHLSGGIDMLHAAAAVHPRPKLWGVTVLTSLTTTDLRILHPKAAVHPTVQRLAKTGVAHKIDGIICSGQEVDLLRKKLGPDTCFITPGIRPKGYQRHDQKRIITPGEAARLGIRFVVIGRPITKANSPLAEAQKILTEMKNAAPASLLEGPARESAPELGRNREFKTEDA
ncbi:MAG: orotidine-5'-phosphate decarboxylase [Elusimicrobiota bacterium]